MVEDHQKDGMIGINFEEYHSNYLLLLPILVVAGSDSIKVAMQHFVERN